MKRLLFFNLLLFIVIICCGCKGEPNSYVSQNEVAYLTIKTTYYDMPQKIVTKKEDISNVINYINDIKKKSINMDSLRGGNTSWIQTYDEDDYMIDSIMFQGKYLDLNGQMYKINEIENERMMDLYDFLDYSETNWEENCLDALNYQKPYKRK